MPAPLSEREKEMERMRLGRKVMAWTGKGPGAARTGVDGRGLRGEIVQQEKQGCARERGTTPQDKGGQPPAVLRYISKSVK